MKEVVMEIGMALFGMAIAVVVFQLSETGATEATNAMFEFTTGAFERVQNK